MELNTHSARGVSFTMSSPSIKFWQRRDRKESRSSSDGREQKPPLVAVEERSSFEYPPVFTATEAAGRASPVIVDVPPRSPSLRSGKSEDKRGSCGTGNSSSRRLSSVSEEDCVQPQEEELYTADKASNSSHSSTDKGDLCVKENQPDESHDDWKSSNTKCSSTAKSDQLNDQQGNQNEQVRAPSSELGF